MGVTQTNGSAPAADRDRAIEAELARLANNPPPDGDVIASLVRSLQYLDPPLTRDEAHDRVTGGAIAEVNACLKLSGPNAIVKVLQLGTAGSLWDVVLRSGQRVPLGSTENLLRSNGIRVPLAEATRTPPPRIKADSYDRVVALLMAVAETETDDDPTAQTREWVLDYARGTALHVDLRQPEKKYEAIVARDRFTDYDGRLWLRPDDLNQWLVRYLSVRLPPGDRLTARLTRIGFTGGDAGQLSARDPSNPSKVVKRRFWFSPAGMVDELPSSRRPPFTRTSTAELRGDSGDNGHTPREGAIANGARGDNAGTSGDGGVL